MAAPLSTLIVLLCSIAVLLVRCDGLKCKRKAVDNDNVTTWKANNTDCASEFHFCFGAECTVVADTHNKSFFIWGCTEDDDTNNCETDLQSIFEKEAKNDSLGKWTCKCIIGAMGKDMDNARLGKGSGAVQHALATVVPPPSLAMRENVSRCNHFISGAATLKLSVVATAVAVAFAMLIT
uniref:UPAR/Ly6 domain-containing protein n=1 Tax=Globodera pallida TaxID=36090 RepID=A0A183CF09_GLOPA